MQPNHSDNSHPSAAHFNRESHPTQSNQQNQQSPHISHQRYRQPARINADDKSNCLLCVYAAVFLLPLTVCIIISALALPHATKPLNPKESLLGTNLENCSGFVQRRSLSTNTLACYNRTMFRPGTVNSLGIFVKLFSNLNQFMLFYMDLSPYANNQTDTRASFNQTIIFTVYAAEYKQAGKNTTVIGKLHSSSITFSTTIRRLRQKQYFLGYQSKIAAGQQFFVEVGFQNNSAISSSSMFVIDVKDLLSKVETVEQNFTIYTILLRVAFFILSLIVLAIYISQLLKAPKSKISVQQRLVQMIGSLTLLFNDQLYFVTVLWPNPVSSFLSALFIWTFLFGLYVLWIFFLVRILYEESDTQTVQLRNRGRLVFLLLFYLIGLTFCAGYAIIQAGEYPMLSVNAVDQVWFRIYFAFLLFCFVIALFYLFYLYVEICRKRPYRPHRHNVFMFVSLLFTTTIIILTLMGSFEVFNFSAGLVFFFFAFNNFYSYFLQYLYAPTKDQLEAFRLIDRQANESQNEVVSQAKTINIQLLSIEEGKGEVQLNGSRDEQKYQNRSEKSIRKRKREAARLHSLGKSETIKGESQDKILKDEAADKSNQKEEISIEQQYYQHDI